MNKKDRPEYMSAIVQGLKRMLQPLANAIVPSGTARKAAGGLQRLRPPAAFRPGYQTQEIPDDSLYNRLRKSAVYISCHYSPKLTFAANKNIIFI